MFAAKEPPAGSCSRSSAPCCRCPSKHKPAPRISSWKMGRSVHKLYVVVTWHLFKNNTHPSLIPLTRAGQLWSSALHIKVPAASVPRCMTDNLLLLYVHHCYFRFPIFRANYRQLFPLVRKNKKTYSAWWRIFLYFPAHRNWLIWLGFPCNLKHTLEY